MILKRKRHMGWFGVVVSTMALVCGSVSGDEPRDDFDDSWSDAHGALMEEIYEELFDSSWAGDPSFLLPELITGPQVSIAVNEVGFPLIIEFGSMAGVFTTDLPDVGDLGAAGAAWVRARLTANDVSVYVDGLLVQYGPDSDEPDGAWDVRFVPARPAVTRELLWEWQHGPNGRELVEQLLSRYAVLIAQVEGGLLSANRAVALDDDDDDSSDPPLDDPEPSLIEHCRQTLLLALEVCRQEMRTDLRDCLEATNDAIVDSERRMEKCYADAAAVSLECLLRCRMMETDDERVQCLLGCMRTVTRMVDVCEREQRRLRALREAQFDCFNNAWISLQACVQAAYMAYNECLEGVGLGRASVSGDG